MGALDRVEQTLSVMALDGSDAERRVLRLIAAYRIQLEKLNRWWVTLEPASQDARVRCADRLAELTEALEEVRRRQRADDARALAEARSCVAEARRAARVDAVHADQFRRDGGTPRAQLRVVV